uniref:Uncharacterized protein n=1 Tax=Panagrolaimus sp. JU765 TaxID=591449 RepID=A0AC34Q7Q0_9BILA
MKDSEFKKKTKELKNLAKDQVQQTDDYFNKMIELEKILEDCRMNISIAKAQNGFTLSTVGMIDNREMEPTIFVQINDDSSNKQKFELYSPEKIGELDNDEKKLRQRKNVDKNDEKEQSTNSKTSKIIPNFRPFGLLEPRSAKIARTKISEALERICEMSNIQNTIFKLEKQIKKLDDEVMNSLGDDYQEFVKISTENIDNKTINDEIKNNSWIKPQVV